LLKHRNLDLTDLAITAYLQLAYQVRNVLPNILHFQLMRHTTNETLSHSDIVQYDDAFGLLLPCLNILHFQRRQQRQIIDIMMKRSVNSVNVWMTHVHTYI